MTPAGVGTKQQEKTNSWASNLIVLAFALAVVVHLWPPMRYLTLQTTDLFLLLCNGWVLYQIIQTQRDYRLGWWLLGTYCFAFAAEVIGVASGSIFGSYTYGPTMRWQLLGVPVIIALNWVVLTLAANQILTPAWKALRQRLGSKIAAPLAAIGAGLVLALYDMTIEPVAIKLEYWYWPEGQVPLQNYLAWACLAAIISWPLRYYRIRFEAPVLMAYFWAQLAFFISLNMVL